MLKAIQFIFYAEFILHLRRSQAWAYPLGFFLMVMTLFPLALTHDMTLLTKILPGCVWIAALLASLLAVENVFFTDLEDSHAECLFFSPIPHFLLILIKLAVVWLVTELPLILVTPLFGWFFQISSRCLFMLVLTLLIGTPILTLIGSLGVALTVNAKQQGILLGLLILPLCIPILIFGVNIVEQFAAHLSVKAPLALLVALLLLAIMLLPAAISAAIRISLDE